MAHLLLASLGAAPLRARYNWTRRRILRPWGVSAMPKLVRGGLTYRSTRPLALRGSRRVSFVVIETTKSRWRTDRMTCYEVENPYRRSYFLCVPKKRTVTRSR